MGVRPTGPRPCLRRPPHRSVGPGPDHHLLDQVRGRGRARRLDPRRSGRRPRRRRRASDAALDRPADADGVDGQSRPPSTCRRRKFLWHGDAGGGERLVGVGAHARQPDGRGQVGPDDQRPGRPRRGAVAATAGDHRERPPAVGPRVGDGDGRQPHRRRSPPAAAARCSAASTAFDRVPADGAADPRWRPGEGQQPAEQHQDHQQRQRVAEHPAEGVGPAPARGRARRSGPRAAPGCAARTAPSTAA